MSDVVIAEVKTEMSLIEKVKLMSDLANACQNEAILNEIKKLPNGDRIFDIFVAAVDRELQGIMNGKKEDVPTEILNTVAMARQLQATLDSFRSLVQGFMGTPLVQVLNMMNQNLGGKAFPQTAATQQPNYPQQPQQTQQQYQEPSYNGSGRGNMVHGL